MIEVRTHWLKESQISDVSADEGSRRLPKRLKFVTLLASVYEPQSRQNYLATQDCSNVFCISTACKDRTWIRCM